MSERIDLGSADLIELLYTFKENGVEKDFILVEAGGDATTAFEARKMSSFKLDKKGMPSEMTDKGHDAPLLLLSKCLFELIGQRPKDGEEDKRTRRPVAEVRVKAWPSRITTTLCEKLMLISKMGGGLSKELLQDKITQLQDYKSMLEDREEQEKNVQTTAGSSSENGLAKTHTT